ncbi:zinc finger protein CONSTANS-LIKE 4-like [Impatiens glandulifera]|uniref:zinc finger protein CONSTANS-LIKE 4-like n=1 Tax=Impatiens glandulifera TaxID=253017 RepID=UPI001FB19404|nr:zinc finger protein CONSTANS-LIKE 4-like [Impatiens glandulifera]
MGKFFPVAAWGMMTAAKSCDSCKSAAAILFCRTDSAFLCVGCDSRHHQISSSAARQVKHERVWMCEVCEQAPASFTCRADAAALCITCDRDIHSANPLASRHERLPVTSFYETAESVLLKSSIAATFNSGESQPDPSLKICPDTMFCDNDQYLDFDSYSSLSLQNCGSDSVVPVQHQIKSTNSPPPAMINPTGPADRYFEIDFSNPQSISHSVSTSSMDVGVVPEGSSISEISYPLGKIIGSGFDLDGSMNPIPAQGSDRQARVMRYREKRKNRKFEKTIRYASRKAYAETRPRIKGRFAKRTDAGPDEMDPIFISGSSACFMGGYGVVPSF